MEKMALLIVDVQKAFDDRKWGKRNNPDAEENISIILKAWREKGLPVIFIKHLSDDPDSLFYPENVGFDIKDIVQPIDEEVIITKKVNSSFIGTNLEERLKVNEITTVVITGLTTPHCISTTTRMSGNLGFKTILISDATAAFSLEGHHDKHYDADTVHEVTLATLHDEFATILTTDQLLNEIYPF